MANKPKRDSAVESVTIRMYRNILGDCFLLTHKRGSTTTRILIDCGVLQGVPGAQETMCNIADDIIKTCEGVLDIVVLTHEHYDHLSGFNLARDSFFSSKLRIKELWVAWTENPDDLQAVALGHRLSSAQAVIADIYKAKVSDNALTKDSRWQTISALSQFLGPLASEEENEFSARGRWTNKIIIEELKKKTGSNSVRYLEPGQTIRAGHPNGIPAYVLGPPRNAARLAKDKPSKGPNKEVYLTNADQTFGLASWAATNLSSTHLQADCGQLSEMPFSSIHNRKLEEIEKHIKDFGIQSVERTYFDSIHSQHTISQDWLHEAESLALKLDSDTNNTSLVLAFELSDGQILLFPGDAQVGNWLSWWDQTYSRQDERGQTITLTADDILRRTTFYKVGHHSSHNATLREKGLLKMTDPRLMAMIPVVEKVALKQGKGWLMPYQPLYEDLLRITDNCVLRGDGCIDKEKQAFKDRKTKEQKAGSYASSTELEHDDHNNNLWVQVTIIAR